MTQTKLIFALIVAVVISVGLSMVAGHYTQLRNSAAVGEQRGGVLQATSEGTADTIDINEFEAGFQAGLDSGRETFKATKQEAIRNEPETATRAVRPVPDSVRNAYRERRLARERLGCAGRECPTPD